MSAMRVRDSEVCPRCKNPVEVYRFFMSRVNNYRYEFNYKCENCGADLFVQVEDIPYFDISLKTSED